MGSKRELGMVWSIRAEIRNSFSTVWRLTVDGIDRGEFISWHLADAERRRIKRMQRLETYAIEAED